VRTYFSALAEARAIKDLEKIILRQAAYQRT